VPVVRDYRELLARADVDAVDVVVPNALHAEIGVAALEAGKDVLLEKPLAPTLEGCDRLIAAARRTGRVLSVRPRAAAVPAVGRHQGADRRRRPGRRRSAVMSLFRFPYRGGSGGWRTTRAAVGSWILEELVHHFDLLLWYFARYGDPIAVERRRPRAHGDPARCRVGRLHPAVRRRTLRVVTLTLSGFEYHLDGRGRGAPRGRPHLVVGQPRPHAARPPSS
jgi:myo-inositol 2-dehydrogenase/D-chiro-inositol 1-dehydrogenase